MTRARLTCIMHCPSPDSTRTHGAKLRGRRSFASVDVDPTWRFLAMHLECPLASQNRSSRLSRDACEQILSIKALDACRQILSVAHSSSSGDDSG